MLKYNRQTPCVYHHIKVMFHGIPKNASTSVKNILYEANWGQPFDGNKQWVHKGNEKGGSIYPSIAMGLSNKFKPYKHFTVVRSPYQRFISFYNDLFLGKTNIRNNIPPFYTDNNINLSKKPIDEVLDIIQSFDDNEADEHFASQASFVYGENVEYLKMENLEKDWEPFSKKINIAFQPLPVYNKSDNAVLLTDNQKEKIYKRYQQDFERFNYER